MNDFALSADFEFYIMYDDNNNILIDNNIGGRRIFEKVIATVFVDIPPIDDANKVFSIKPGPDVPLYMHNILNNKRFSRILEAERYVIEHWKNRFKYWIKNNE